MSDQGIPPGPGQGQPDDPGASRDLDRHHPSDGLADREPGLGQLNLFQQSNHIHLGSSGAFPFTPAELNEYELLHPGFMDRWLTMSEKEQEFRHTIVHKQVDGVVEETKRAPKYALTALFGLFVLAGGMTYLEAGAEAASMVGVVAVGLVVAFVAKGRRDAQEDDGGSNSKDEASENKDV